MMKSRNQSVPVPENETYWDRDRTCSSRGFADSKSKAGAASGIQLEGSDCTVRDLGQGISEGEAAPDS